MLEKLKLTNFSVDKVRDILEPKPVAETKPTVDTPKKVPEEFMNAMTSAVSFVH